MKTEKKKEMYLRLEITGRPEDDTRLWSISLCILNDKQVPRSWELETPWDDFMIRAYFWNPEDLRRQPEKKAQPVFGWGAGFQNHFIDLWKCEKQAKAASKLLKKLEAMQATLGSANTFAEYVLRVGVALGVKGYVRRRTNFTDGDNPYIVIDGASARYYIEAIQREHVQKIFGEEEARNLNS